MCISVEIIKQGPMTDEKFSHLTCNQPEFIQQYFQQSRLHHLSTWKADLSEFVGDVMTSSSRVHRPSSLNTFPRIIMHVDMDCFFASVGIRDRPELSNKPVAVAHSRNDTTEKSSSEIASCNYVARAKGVKNGMFVGTARALAPDLVLIPYDYEKYDSCSRSLYRVLIEKSDFVQAVSCDEAYIDVSFIIAEKLEQEGLNDSVIAKQHRHISPRISKRIEELSCQLAESIRDSIVSQTRCTASVGISHNMLLARVATSKAKPNGCFYLTQENILPFMRALTIRSLPGIGYMIEEKCKELNLLTCGDLQLRSFDQMQQNFGQKTGKMMWDYVSGRDDRILENKVRQTIGAEINWGIRFVSHEQVAIFLHRFCAEVFRRLDSTQWMAKHVTVTAKKKLYEGEPEKFLGCGHCQDLSRSLLLKTFVATSEDLYHTVSQLFDELALTPNDVRGIGIHLKKLQRRGNSELVAQSLQRNRGIAPFLTKVPTQHMTSQVANAQQLSKCNNNEEEPNNNKSSTDEKSSVFVDAKVQQLLTRSSWVVSSSAPLLNSHVDDNDVIDFEEMDDDDFLFHAVIPDELHTASASNRPHHSFILDGQRAKPFTANATKNLLLKQSDDDLIDLCEESEADYDKSNGNVEVERIASSSNIKSFFEPISRKNSSTKRDPNILNQITANSFSGKKRVFASTVSSKDPTCIPAELKGIVDMEVFMALPQSIRDEQIQFLLHEERARKLRK
jgi:nucleotidyltransferase/DNA polymerase involved in DNA repair